MGAIDATTMAKLTSARSATGIGSLPHRDVGEALQMALLEQPGIPFIPTVPRLNPAEGMIAQAVTGIPGISVGQYGAILADARRIDAAASVTTDLAHGAFAGYRAYLAHRLEDAQGHEFVKWQFTGPVTLGQALIRAGVPIDIAFDVAMRAVRTHVRNLFEAISEVAPDTTQIMVIDEPDLASLMHESFPISADRAIDLMSGAMAVLEDQALVGLHCCAPIDVVPLISAGPAILSIPASRHLTAHAGALATFLERGGVIAWGVVPTDGPVMATAERSSRALAKLWCDLVQDGCDAGRIWRQSLVTPACGLAQHTPTTAMIIMNQVREIGERIRTQAVAAQLTVGA